MATADQEYLEYKVKANSTFSESKQRIDELKEQLESMDLSHSNQISETLFLESPVKTKDQVNIYGQREKTKTEEKVLQDNFMFESQEKINRNELDPDMNKRAETQRTGNFNAENPVAENDQVNLFETQDLLRLNSEPLPPLSSVQHNVANAKAFGRDTASPISQENIVEQQTNPELVLLQENLKEGFELWRKSKNEILQNLSSLQQKRTEFEEIEALFKEKVVSAGNTESLLKEEINEVKERLAIIQVIKDREIKMSLRNKKKWMEALKKLEQEILELKVKQKQLEELIRSIRQEATDLHTFEMK